MKTIIAENIAKANKEEFFEWLSKQMLKCDPNGEYDKVWMESNPRNVLKTLLQWVEDSGGVDCCYYWLCLAITKLNVLIKKGGD